MLNTIFLIGYMGAGKSVVGRLLSQINGFNFYDLDEYIEAKEGKKVSEIFNENNEVYFRKIENKYLKEISLLKTTR
jgi:shikimate kinase